MTECVPLEIKKLSLRGIDISAGAALQPLAVIYYSSVTCISTCEKLYWGEIRISRWPLTCVSHEDNCQMGNAGYSCKVSAESRIA